jgi:hypothetical protein
VTEWMVTEWTESENWTESTETYEAKRSASRNWTESTEAHAAKRSALRFQQNHRGDYLAALLLLIRSRGGLVASLRAYSPKWPIEIWYGEDLTQ